MHLKTKNFIKARLKFFIVWISIIFVSASALTAIMYFIGQGVSEEEEVEKEEVEASKSVFGRVKKFDLLNKELLLEDFDYYIDTYYWDDDSSCVIIGIDPDCASGGSCDVIEDDCDLDKLDELESELEYSVTIISGSNNQIESIILANGLYGM